jgi:hypothetical protein
MKFNPKPLFRQSRIFTVLSSNSPVSDSANKSTLCSRTQRQRLACPAMDNQSPAAKLWLALDLPESSLSYLTLSDHPDPAINSIFKLGTASQARFNGRMGAHRVLMCTRQLLASRRCPPRNFMRSGRQEGCNAPLLTHVMLFLNLVSSSFSDVHTVASFLL